MYHVLQFRHLHVLVQLSAGVCLHIPLRQQNKKWLSDFFKRCLRASPEPLIKSFTGRHRCWHPGVAQIRLRHSIIGCPMGSMGIGWACCSAGSRVLGSARYRAGSRVLGTARCRTGSRILGSARLGLGPTLLKSLDKVE